MGQELDNRHGNMTCVFKVVKRVALVKSSNASDIVYKLLHDVVAQNNRFGSLRGLQQPWRQSGADG
jgi:hypothetical protein